MFPDLEARRGRHPLDKLFFIMEETMELQAQHTHTNEKYCPTTGKGLFLSINKSATALVQNRETPAYRGEDLSAMRSREVYSKTAKEEREGSFNFILY